MNFLKKKDQIKKNRYLWKGTCGRGFLGAWLASGHGRDILAMWIGWLILGRRGRLRAVAKHLRFVGGDANGGLLFFFNNVFWKNRLLKH